MKLTIAQLKLLVDILDLAAGEFSNHGCIDYILDNTPENLELVKDIIASGDYPDDEPHVCGGKITTGDSIIMRYFIELFLAELRTRAVPIDDLPLFAQVTG